MRRSVVFALLALGVTGSAFVACTTAEPPSQVADASMDDGNVPDTGAAPNDATLPPEASVTPDAGLDTSTGADAESLDAGADADLDGGAADGSVDAASDAAVDAGPPVVLVDGTTFPILGFDFNDTTLVYRDSRGFHTCPLTGCAAPVANYTSLALSPPARFTVSGTRLYWVSAGAPATTFEIRSLDADTLTLQRKENMLFCTSVMFLRAEASATISVYRASSSSTGSNPQTLSLNRTPNLSRTGVATEGHCVATGCQTATHTYAIVAGSIVRTPK